MLHQIADQKAALRSSSHIQLVCLGRGKLQIFCLCISCLSLPCSHLTLPSLISFVAVIASSLSALVTWVEWTPMARITSSNVIDACSFFMDSKDFRLQALDVLKQVRGGGRIFKCQQGKSEMSFKSSVLLQLLNNLLSLLTLPTTHITIDCFPQTLY